MRKYAFIPTRDESSKNKSLEEFLKGAGFEVTFLINQESIFKAYSDSCKQVLADDIVIFCHDDIKILNSIESFNTFLEDNLKDKTTGFVGVAGARVFNQSAVWWEGAQSNGSPNHSGIVWHGKKLDDITLKDIEHYRTSKLL